MPDKETLNAIFFFAYAVRNNDTDAERGLHEKYVIKFSARNRNTGATP